MIDLSHEPRPSGDMSMGNPIPLVFSVKGPNTHDETECYLCSVCGVFYEDDAGNVCAAKLAKVIEK